MKKYFSFFKIRFIDGLQYRSAAYAGIVTQFFWGLMEILMFSAFYKSNSADFPMEFSQLASYIWLQQAFLALFMTWFWENDIFENISNGGIAYELCRPVDIYGMWFTKSMSTRMAKAVLRCFPILIVAFFLPEPYCLKLPFSASAGLLFLISAALAFLIVIALSMFIYISAFYTISAAGIKLLFTSLTEFLSGAVIPLPFFPKSIQNIISILPFASMQNTPFLIYSGAISGSGLIQSILLQMFWCIILIFFGKVITSMAVKRVVVQGG